MNVIRWLFVGGALLTACGVQPMTAASCDLKINIVSSFGDALHDADVVLKSIGPADSYSTQGSEAKFPHLPFGMYQLRVRLAGFYDREEIVRIYQANLRLIVGLDLMTPHSFIAPELFGTVNFKRKSDTVKYVRLVALYSSEFFENEVDPSGHFHISGMPSGKYALLILEGGKTVALKDVILYGGNTTIVVSDRLHFDSELLFPEPGRRAGMGCAT
jgi:hypothetical protein